MLDLQPNELREGREILQARVPRHRVLASGSRAEGRARPHSDLDLVVMERAAIPDLAWAELAADFEDSNLPFRVDLLRWQELTASMQQHIQQHSILITD
ncbi:MAG: nucleotidyltransferase domain-containing protein [Erythrobacter tepidarius]